MQTQRSGLLALPPELRNSIYEYAFADTDSAEKRRPAIDFKFDRCFANYGLSLTNHQIYTETIELYYQSLLNTLPYETSAAVGNWYSKLIGPCHARLSCLEFTTQPEYDYEFMHLFRFDTHAGAWGKAYVEWMCTAGSQARQGWKRVKLSRAADKTWSVEAENASAPGATI